MEGLTFPSLTNSETRSGAWQDTLSADRPDALILAADPLVAHGVARILEHASAIGRAELHGNIEAALTGPAVPLLVVHSDTPDLTAEQVAALLGRRHAVALLAAGPRQGAGLAALRSAGARGVLSGAETPALCAQMIQLVLAGGSCWTADLAPQSAAAHFASSPHRDSIRLTQRQWQVAAELVQGRSNKIIGRNLGISEGTVKIHMTEIFRALGVGGRAAAVARLIHLLDPTVCRVAAHSCQQVRQDVRYREMPTSSSADMGER